MQSTTQNTPEIKDSRSPDISGAIVPLAAVWNLIVAAALGLLAINILGVENFGNLGRPVQVFAAIAVTIPAILLVVASGYLTVYRQRANTGRYITVVIHFVAMVLGFAILAGLVGVYDGFEYLVDGVMQNAAVTLGFVVAYVITFIAGRMNEFNPVRQRLNTLAYAIAGITLVWLLLLSDFLGGMIDILSHYSDPITWGLTIFAVMSAVVSIRLLMMGRAFDELPEQRTAWQGWLMLAPNIIGFLVFFAGPLLLSFYLSFTNSSVGQIPEVVGLQNYADLIALEFKVVDDVTTNAQNFLSFGYTTLGEISLGANRLIVGAKDTLFWLALRNTLIFCLFLVPLSVLPALGLSLILNSSLPGVKFFRAIYFLPSVAAVVGTALIWRWLYDPTIGYFNYIITNVVTWLNSTFGVSLTDPNIQWLTGPGVVLFSIVLLAAWQVVGYNTVLFLAGLQGIPKVLYEAAMIDGANRWQQFRNVTFPMLAPTTFFVMITTIVTGLQVFNEPYALFPSRPIPVNATTAVFYLYNKGFTQFEFGYASAVAWVLFGLIFTITLIQFRINRNEAYE